MDIEEEISETPETDAAPTAMDSVAAALEEIEKAPEASKEEPKKDTKPRDDAGKFAKDSKDTDAKEASKTTEPAIKEIPAYVKKSWTLSEQAAWEKMPPEAQAAVLRREEDVHKGFTRMDEEREYGRQFKDAVTPYSAYINSLGISPKDAVAKLLQTEYNLRNSPPHLKIQQFQQLARDYGVDLRQISQAPAAPDPNAIVAQIPQLVQKQLDDYQQKQADAQLRTVIDAFAADPKNIHYERVKPVMAALLQSGAAKDMQNAYDMAINADPEIRSTLAAVQEAEKEAKRIADIQAQTAKARKASSSIAGAPSKANGVKRPVSPNHSTYDSVAQAYAEMEGR